MGGLKNRAVHGIKDCWRTYKHFLEVIVILFSATLKIKESRAIKMAVKQPDIWLGHFTQVT